MFLWVLRLLYTSKEDLQFPQNERLAGELAALPGTFAPVYELLPPTLPPRTRSTGKEGHTRNISDVSYASNSSYGSQSTGMHNELQRELLLLLLLLLLIPVTQLPLRSQQEAQRGIVSHFPSAGQG